MAYDHHGPMQLSVSDLKARLSQYLQEVRSGGEVLVLDRGVPVARLAGAAEKEGLRVLP